MNYLKQVLTLLQLAMVGALFGASHVTAQPSPTHIENQLSTKRSSANIRQVSTDDPPKFPLDFDRRSLISPATGSQPAVEGVRPPLTPWAESDPTTTHEIFEDFVHGSNNTALEKINQLAAAGGGTGQGWGYGTTYEDAWGVIEARHGTGPYSRLDLVGKTPNMFAVAVGIGTAYEYQVRFNFATLSTPENRYVTFDGFFDGDTVDPEFNRGILFRYSDDINNGRFQVVVRFAPDVETLIDTGVTPVVDTWYRLKVSVNASGTEALFYINDVRVASVYQMPTGPLNRYTVESDNDRLSGTTPFVSRRFDYVRFRATAGRGSRL